MAPDTLPPSGTFDGALHRFPVRIYFEDTDAAGIVYYANYLKFAERARTEMLRRMGADHSGLMGDTGAAFAVRHLSADYRRPARLDDALHVVTRIDSVGGATLAVEQTVERDGEPLVVLTMKLAFMTAGGRPARLPDAVRRVFEGYVTAPA